MTVRVIATLLSLAFAYQAGKFSDLLDHMGHMSLGWFALCQLFLVLMGLAAFLSAAFAYALGARR